MKFTITGRDWSSLVEVEDGTVKSADNESISILVGKNWDHVQKKCGDWGWTIEPYEQIEVLWEGNVLSSWPFIDLTEEECQGSSIH